MPTKKSVTACDDPMVSCPPKKRITSGRKLIVEGDDGCDAALSVDCGSPAVLAGSKNKVKFIDGSVANPLELPFMQRTSVAKAPSILIQQPDGTILRWEPPSNLCGKFKLTVEDGAFNIEEDVIPHIVPSDICVTTCGNVDYLLGVKITKLQCKSGSRRIMQIMAVPKNCNQSNQTSSVEI